jgi:5'(3')-deoxyribonucleotidase
MVLCIDVDNTINNLQEEVLNKFNERHKKYYTIEDMTDYNVENCIDVLDAKFIRAMYVEKGVYDTVRPLEGAQKALQKLVNMGHQVYLVTAFEPHVHVEKVEWIRSYFSFVDDSHIIAMNHKYLLHPDVMIEDNLDNLLAKPYYDRILIDRPWNRTVRDFVYDIHRCTNWEQIVDAVNKLNLEE